MARKPKFDKPVEVDVKPSRGDGSRSSENRESRVTKGGCTKRNDVSWYAKDPRLIIDAASIPFAEPLGPDVIYGPNKRSIPGVCVLYYAQTVGPIGLSAPGQAAINLAALNYYSWLRHANSGSRNYDPNDLIQILLGVGGVFEVIAWSKRLYSLLRDYKMENRYYSKRIIEAMNVDFDDMLSNLANLRYLINASIARVGIYSIPKDMSFLMRRIWMAESIFLDANMRKAQTYVYCPLYVHAYDWTNAEVRLEPWHSDGTLTNTTTTDPDGVAYVTGKIQFAGLKATLEDLISRIAFNTDVGIISGDLLKAYGESGLFKMEQIAEDFHIEPTFNLEVMTQIHNAECVIDTAHAQDIDLPTNHTFTITQNGAMLAYDSTNGNPAVTTCYLVSPHSSPKIGSTNYGNVREDLHLIDMPIDPVDPAHIMVATRLMVTRELSAPDTAVGEGDYLLTDFGTEVLLFAKLYSLHTSFYYSTWLCNDTGLPVDDLLQYTTPFSFIPRGYVFAKQTNVPNTGEVSWLFDEIEIGTIDNYTVISDAVLSKMHQTAVVSEFSIPLSGLNRR